MGIFATGFSFAQEGYRLRFKVKGAADSTIYLANYFGKKLYYRDTAKADSKGYFEFTGKKMLDGGMYAVVLPGTKYFEIIVREPEIYLETDTANFTSFMVVKDSKENTIFYDYIKFINRKRMESQPWKNKKDQLKKQIKAEDIKKKDKDALEAELKDVEARLAAIDSTVFAYQKSAVADNKETLVAKLLNCNIDIELPEPPLKEDGTKDETFQYHYYRRHFFDNVDFNEDDLVRSPIYHSKLERFFKKTIIQHPDTITKWADRILDQIPATSKDLWRYTVHHITYTYETSKLICMDAVFVHMAENYYNKGLCYWMDDKKLKKVKDRTEKLKPTLCGKKAPYLNLMSLDETEFKSLYEIPADNTILIFWDSGCGHCKKEMPKLKELYADFKDKSVEVYAVGTEFETKEWKKYLNEKEMLDWINVSDNPVYPDNFRNIYDIFSTPKIFLLDKDKNIKAKGIGVSQLREILEKETASDS